MSSVDTFTMHAHRNIQENPLIFVDYKLMEIQEKKRSAGFCHVLSTVVQDLDPARMSQYQTFCRGDAAVIFDNCTEYWDGERVQHLTD